MTSSADLCRVNYVGLVQPRGNVLWDRFHSFVSWHPITALNFIVPRQPLSNPSKMTQLCALAQALLSFVILGSPHFKSSNVFQRSDLDPHPRSRSLGMTNSWKI